jgi:predicted transposase YbfD/YdcC
VMEPASMLDHFASLSDPRVERTRRHNLLDIIAIALCAVICGADNWVDVELFGQSKEEWLRSWLELPNGIPSHDTFGRVFARLDAAQFAQCLTEWVAAVAQAAGGQVVALDGKALRGSRDGVLGKDAILTVSAWATTSHLVLGQVQVEEGSNEITAIPRLLEILSLEGCTVTIDAIGTQTAIAEQIVDKGGDYVLAVKDNQAGLCEELEDLFATAEQFDFADVPHTYERTAEREHGRLEVRQCWATTDHECLAYLSRSSQWRGLASVAKVVRKRRLDGHHSEETVYYISSRAAEASWILDSCRTHWGIENGLHWVLDVAFAEDHCRVRKDNGPANFAILRRLALNLLKADCTTKAGIKARRLKAGWDEAYLLSLINQ